jgi:catechol 2,3-dioxygenase-like lactoylglutathione lyase family enzyme
MSLVQLAAAQVTSAPEKATTERSVVRRSTLIVHDADASIRFYRDVLGFSVWLENRGTVTAKSLPSDAPVGAPSRFVIVKGKHPWVGMIGLLQYGDAQKPDLASTKLVPGDVVLMIETDDLDGAYERMKAAGTRILRPPETTEVTGAGGQKWIASFVFAFDPDGHLIELNHRRWRSGRGGARQGQCPAWIHRYAPGPGPFPCRATGLAARNEHSARAAAPDAAVRAHVHGVPACDCH